MQVVKPSKRTHTVYVRLAPYRNGKFNGKAACFTVYGVGVVKLKKFLLAAVEKGSSNGRN